MARASSSSTSSRSGWELLPVSGAYDFSLQPAWTWEFARSFLSHWFLPFLTLFLVAFGGWAIGMRNLIIYELEAEYANYLQSLGAPSKLVRKYAYGNAVLPQMSGLALALGAVVGGALVTEIVFGYPGRRHADPRRAPEPRLLPAAGAVPAHHHRRPDRQLHRRHPLRDGRPANAHGDPGVVVSSAESHADLVATPEVALTGQGADEIELGPRGKRFETLHFALPQHEARHRLLRRARVPRRSRSSGRGSPTRRRSSSATRSASRRPRSTGSGRPSPGQDVYAQFVYGLRSSFIVGALAAVIAAAIGMAVGFVGGYRGGVIDDVLSMLTNIVLVIPTLAVLIIVSAYLSVGSLRSEAILIGLTSWPWAARAIRAQTFSLASREFVSLARLSGQGTTKVILREIAPNMSSYLFLTFILLFGGAVLTAATLDFLGLGPSQVMSLGLMMNTAVSNAALQLGMWWWFIPPGVGITAIVGGLYVMNVGLDEVFNPRLRRT